ncbi:MAG TPA: CYTH domain-containing protein, partial [Negativicutes bacterium]|nr:CYTH domain-containing protein [Negativicutes bacterium]
MPGLDTELELKLRLLTPAAWATVFDAPALTAGLATPPRDEHLETWYFDTADGYLQEAGLAYRIRLEGGRWTATVKADEAVGGGLHQRREWNVTVDEPNPSYDYFRGTEAGSLLADAGEGEPLVLRFSTIFDRQKADIVTADGSRIEAAVDRGTIFAGGREETIDEVELELKEGSPAAVLALGAELVRQLPLAVESRSKYYRALVLAGLDGGMDPLVNPPLAPDGAALAGTRNLIAGQIGMVFAAYEAFGADRGDAETIHRLRVQLRRLRSLLSLARPLADPEEYESWQQELGALSQTTHGLREADVVAAAWE